MTTSQRKIKRNILRTRVMRAGLVALLLQAAWVGPVWGETREEHHMTLDITANQNWVGGPGKSLSSLPTGHAYVGSDFSYNYLRMEDDKKFTFTFRGRSTDDQSVDKQTWSLTSMSLGWSDARRNLVLGDVMANYSTYSISSSLKGASIDFLSPAQSGQPQVSLIYGVGYPRWDNFWGGSDIKAIKRMVGGVNVRQSFEKADVGLSFVRSIDSNRVNDFDPLYSNRVYAFNWELRPQDGMNVKGESAYSFTNQSQSLGGDNLLYHGYAHQVVFSHNVRHQKWQYEFERVSPNFSTLTGSAITDQEKMKLRWTREVSPDLSVNAGVAASYDMLPGSSRTFRTTLYQPELSLSFRSPFNRDNASLDVGLRLDRRFNEQTNTADRVITTNYRDTWNKVDADVGLEYQFNDTTPYDFGMRSKNLAFNLTLATSINKTDYNLRPTLTIACSRSMDMLGHYEDRLFESSIGLGYSRPQDNFSANFKIGQNQNLKQINPDSSRWFGSLRVEAQPKYLKMLNANAKQFLEINKNTYKFDDAGNNYRETSVITGVHFEF